jgi:pyruvate, water dikinase
VIFSGKGTVVQGGVCSGRVYVSRSADDLKDFPNGAILVAQYTSPKYSRIMRKANGIITDIGSPTGHMATIAREFRVPAIVDTGVATSMLKTGDEITLDASHNAVYRGTIKELNKFELTEQEVFEESYEYRLLRRLLKKISPLNLIDTHSDNFKPSQCRTYHDITRYIHQKAVERLIDLSENYQKYHDKTPKRLDSEIPLGIMVIDVENGTDAPRESRSVSVDQIRSLPLRALLEGLSESGMWGTDPAPVNLSSFMSSVTKTFSGPMAMPNKLSRNLAVVSREYMNLNLRLGYHFNIVDAFIGDTLNDNYIYFRFLGGVTDFVHRSRRAKFIAEVLDQFDFRVEVHGDLVIGRLKKNSKERMYCKMKVLGGLIGYTRQLDVSMDSEGMVARFYSDFTQRILPLMEVHDGCSIGIR